MGKRKQVELIQGHANHRRTEGDYMGVLLDTVSLEDWRGVVTGALQAAKGGDTQARNWLAQYLMGRAESKAPTPLNIVVQQLNGTDKLLDTLAHDAYMAAVHPGSNVEYKAHIRAQLTAEMQQKIKQVETIENTAPMRVSGDGTPETTGN
jgi:hypothetical protein